jgi:surface antigen
MKKLITLALGVAILATPATAAAQPVSYQTDIQKLFKLNLYEFQPATTPVLVQPPKPVEKEKPAEQPKPEPVVYTVVEGDNLTKIGTAYNVEWQRLWAKNTQLTNPDLIHVGDKITIPLADEKLEREIPAAVSLPAVTPNVATPTPQATSGNFGGGNTYSYGYCTWYVKNRRGASLPNGLGNANTWYARASAMGMAVGSTPAKGAVGTTTRGALGYVVYVEGINDNGTIRISEMNAPHWGKVTYRDASPSEFVYIY